METIKQNSIKAWVLAARPRTLSGAAVPVALGCALAQSDHAFRPLPALLCLLFALLMQVAANFINDLIDCQRGSDGEDRLGPKRACSQGWITLESMRTGIILTLFVAGFLGCGLLYWGGWELILIGLLCVIAAYLYSAGPYPLSYNGWGDLLVLLFFGLIPVGGTYYVQTGTLHVGILIAGIACGLLIDSLLVVNNYRDREQDGRNGKRTLIVRFGETFGSNLYLSLGLAACLFLGGWWVLNEAYETSFCLLPYLLLHIRSWQQMVRIRQGYALNQILGATARNILIFGIAGTIGILLLPT